MMFGFLIYEIINYFTIYIEHHSIFSVFKFAIFTIGLEMVMAMIGIFFTIWFQIMISALIYQHIHYDIIKQKINLYIRTKWWKFSKIILYLLSSNLLLFSVSFRYNREMMEILRQVCYINAIIMKLSFKVQYLVGCYYYLFMLANNILLFVLTQRNISPFVRIVSCCLFVVTFTVLLCGLITFTSYNILAQTLLSHLNQFQYHCTGLQQITIEPFHAQINEKRIGFVCAKMFVFNTKKTIHILVMFMLNNFLLVDLFANYI